ncbi:MAG: ester cyclase [bacterium]
MAEHLQAENDHDLDRILATYGEDPLVLINHQIFEGLERIKLFHEKFGFSNQGSFSEVKVEEKRRYESPDAIILELVLSGRHTGEWQGVKPTGRCFELPVCTVYLFDDKNKLSGERVYFDQALLMKELGLLPDRPKP